MTDSYLQSIFSFHKQFQQAYEESAKIQLPAEFSKASNIIIAGMGGSIFGGLVLQSAFSSQLKIPLTLLSDYLLPAFADDKTLFVASSYSGNTEETINSLKEAIGRECKVVAVSSGGVLSEYVNGGKVPGYIYDPKYSFNPKIPRIGVGYAVGSVIGILSKLGLLGFSDEDMESLVRDISSYSKTLEDSEKSTSLFSKLKGKIPVFVSSGHTNCAAHIWRNFLNETSKNVAFNLQIPDMNHHFLDGLEFPEDASSNLVFVFLESDLYHPRNRQRFKITKSVVQKRGYGAVVFKTSGKSKMLDIWEIIIFGCVVSHQLAIAHKADPAANEMVDYLKSELGPFQADFSNRSRSSIPTIL